MACGAEWWNLAAGVLSGVGGTMATVGSWEDSGGVARSGGIVAAVSGLTWTISALVALVNCYQANGVVDTQLAQLNQRITQLQVALNYLQGQQMNVQVDGGMV